MAQRLWWSWRQSYSRRRSYWLQGDSTHRPSLPAGGRPLIVQEKLSLQLLRITREWVGHVEGVAWGGANSEQELREGLERRWVESWSVRHKIE